MSSILLINNGEVYTPEPAKNKNILCIHGRIASVGDISITNIDQLGIDYQIIDAQDCLVIPGIIDSHQHLTGGSGEKGYATATPEISIVENVIAGTTTVVGCLGADTITKSLGTLLGRVRAFNEEGLTAYMYVGGYSVPPKTLTGNITTDLTYIPEVIGVGEVAISDVRGSQPSIYELARIAAEAYVGGILNRKSGVMHIHLGPGERGLAQLFELVRHHDVRPQSLYPTHCQRSELTLRQASELSQMDVMIDFDTEDENLVESLQKYSALDGKFENLTLSSDASFSSPSTLFEQIRIAKKELDIPFEKLLAMVTRNPSRVLGLQQKGKIAPGADADFLILNRDDLSIRDVIAHGKVFVRNSKMDFQTRALTNSNRKIELYGQKKGKSDR